MKTSTPTDQLSLFLEESQRDQTLPVVVDTAVRAARITNRSDCGPIVVGDALRMQVGAESAPELDADGKESETECEWSAFLRQYGRVPTIRDEKKPWQYRGWLLYYRLLLEAHPGIGGRWDYWCRTMQNGHVLPEPIPQVQFAEIADPSVFKKIEHWVRLVDSHGALPENIDYEEKPDDSADKTIVEIVVGQEESRTRVITVAFQPTQGTYCLELHLASEYITAERAAAFSRALSFALSVAASLTAAAERKAGSPEARGFFHFETWEQAAARRQNSK